MRLAILLGAFVIASAIAPDKLLIGPESESAFKAVLGFLIVTDILELIARFKP